MAYAHRRRGVLLTDGATYSRTISGLLPISWLSKKEYVPQAYVVDAATGKSTFTMQFPNKGALPYGMAEDPRVSIGPERRIHIMTRSKWKLSQSLQPRHWRLPHLTPTVAATIH